MIITWNFVPCSLIIAILMKKVVSTPKPSINFFQTTRINIPGNNNFWDKNKFLYKIYVRVYCARIFYLLKLNYILACLTLTMQVAQVCRS